MGVMWMPRGIPAKGVMEARRRAMGLLKDTLVREGRSQAWLVRELGRRGFSTSQQSMSNYVNGYSRITRPMLGAACILACGNNGHMGEMLRDNILSAAGDESLLIQGKRQTASA